jgi:curved DNA-binding protein CbpA
MAPDPTEDYYLALEVEENAMLAQITKSYRRLARKLHPDHNKDAGAT